MTQVIKRGGGRQKFMPEKIRKSIRKAATGSRISQEKKYGIPAGGQAG